ncbi:MAG: hypothetical protein ACRDAM_05100, partial [Casimicrobium sp.]
VSDSSDAHTIAWPARPQGIEAALNRIGAEIVIARGTRETRAAIAAHNAQPFIEDTPPLLVAQQFIEFAERAGDRRRYRMLRTPDRALLDRDPSYPKLAAFMAYKVVSAHDIERHTRVRRETIASFLKTLSSAKLLRTIEAASPITQTGPASVAQKTISPSPSPAPAPGGLLSRIRGRLTR